MELVRIYECFCDETRLRILNLLLRGPLCVCHFQEVLGLSQVRISKHLAYLRQRSMVARRRRGTWMVYSLPARRSPELEANLRCLQDCAPHDARFREDLARLEEVHSGIDGEIARKLGITPGTCTPIARQLSETDSSCCIR